jgi:hypothetical protein
MSPAEPKRPFEMTDKELFDLYCAASGSALPSPNQNLYGAEILRRRYGIEQRNATAAEATTRAARWAAIGAWLAALAALVGVIVSLCLHSS